MFLTRLGFDSKAVITGDITQTDLPRGQRIGLRDALELRRRASAASAVASSPTPTSCVIRWSPR